MHRFLPKRALVSAPLAALLLTATASAADTPREQIPVESWSFSAPATASAGGGVSGGKVSYSDLSVMVGTKGGVSYSDFSVMKQWD
jgi:hypothetical protein